MSEPGVDHAVLYAVVPDFYAEVERRDAPALAGRPIVVGGDPVKRGKVQSASVEARRAGVAVGDPMDEALAACPGAIRLPTDMKRYREAQGALITCLRGVAEALEPAELGAAYLDARPEPGTPLRRAERLVEAVRHGLGLPLRVGIAPTKLIARLSTLDDEGPSVRALRRDEVVDFMAPLHLSCLPRVGKKALARLEDLGAQSVGDVLELGAELLERELGARGRSILEMARGGDPSRVRATRRPKSISREETLGGSASPSEVADALRRLAAQLERLLSRDGLSAGRIALKVRFGDQGLVTRSSTLGDPVREAADLFSLSMALLERVSPGERPIRGLGLTLAGLASAAGPDDQLELFPS